MQVAHVTTSIGGALVLAARRWEVLTPVGEPPQRVFRQVLYLRFAMNSEADGIRIDQEKTAWHGVFEPHTYNAVNTGSAVPAAKLAPLGQGSVKVELDAPRQVIGVQLVSALALGANAAVEFYRLDGDKPAQQPTASAQLGVDTVQLDIVQLMESRAVPRSFAGVPPGGAPPAAVGEHFARVSAFATNVATLPSNIDFTDARFALRLNDPAQASSSLQTSDIVSVQARAYPTAPRLGLASPDDLAAVSFFARLDGEIGKGAQPQPGEVDAGGDFAMALQRHLDERLARLAAASAGAVTSGVPPPIDVALVIASDAPCQVAIEQFAVEYSLLRSSFPAQADKRVLRFAGAQIETQTLTVRLPVQAHVQSAVLRVAPGFRSDRPAGAEADSALTGSAPGQAQGVYIGSERWAAQPVTPVQALAVSGIVLGLLALSNGTRLLFELHTDWQGQPSGKKLVEATLDLARSGERTWKTLHVSNSVVLPAQPHWLLLKATRGAAVWLVAPGEPGARLLETSQRGAAWRTVSVLVQMQALYRFFSPTTSAAGQAPDTAPFTLAVASQVVTPQKGPGASEQRDAMLTFDLAEALNVYLKARATALPGTVVNIGLAFSTGLPGIATVYAPEIAYELTG